MKKSEHINEIAKAMALAQNQMKPASKDALNPHFKTKYSNISSIWEAMRIPVTSNGITVLQDVTTSIDMVSVCTTLLHISGQWLEFGPLSIPLNKKDAHGVGSAISYAKRYALCACIGVVSDDDDDDGASAIKTHTKQDAAPPPQPDVTQEQIDAFCAKHGVGSGNLCDKYINLLAGEKKMAIPGMIIYAMKNEAGFIQAFDKWRSQWKDQE